MGADFGYIGSAFIACDEANAVDGYKDMIVNSDAKDIVYSNLFTGVHGNYLAPSVAQAGLDPNNLPESDPSAMNAGTGNSPCFVLPGDGSADWNGAVPLDQIPQATGSAMRPFIASANQDQAGVTFDNNPHNDRHYIGCDFADGIRQTRIAERLRMSSRITVEDMQRLQGDKVILYGRKLRPPLPDSAP